MYNYSDKIHINHKIILYIYIIYKYILYKYIIDKVHCFYIIHINFCALLNFYELKLFTKKKIIFMTILREHFFMNVLEQMCPLFDNIILDYLYIYI